MAGTFDAGSVVYEVDMDTSRLLAARREVDAALNGLNGSMGRLEASVNRTERSIDRWNEQCPAFLALLKACWPRFLCNRLRVTPMHGLN